MAWHFALVLFLSLLPSPSSASRGDQDPYYRKCWAACRISCGEDVDRPVGFNASVVTELYAAAVVDHQDAAAREAPRPVPLGSADRALRWTCGEDCGYRCMHASVAHWTGKGYFWEANYGLDPVQQYHGKWPFIRYLGTQEIASTSFSVANALPHAYYLFVVPRAAFDCPPGQAHYGWAWRLWPVVSLNTWLWSAVFHARDTWVTERLDYHFATAYLVYVCFALAIDLLPTSSGASSASGTSGASSASTRGRSTAASGRVVVEAGEVRGVPLVAAAFLALWVGHCAYLNLVKFDYGWNMTVSVLLYLLSKKIE
eukprot:g4464.t1